MRGWTEDEADVRLIDIVFPARAGMDRLWRTWMATRLRFPRACGDGPSGRRERPTHRLFSPRVRGWTATARSAATLPGVFPARAGMDRYFSCFALPSSVFPRACGDGPTHHPVFLRVKVFSPRVRGWTEINAGEMHLVGVFPARAGMDRQRPRSNMSTLCFPRACGDGPEETISSREVIQFSPRVRGWTVWSVLTDSGRLVFPARAGMDRTARALPWSPTSFPRACGDGPPLSPSFRPWPPFSPRVRGWTVIKSQVESRVKVFPARAGMDRA